MIKDLELDQIILQVAQKNDREYEQFLKKHNLEKSWDSWDMFSEEKWNY